MVGGGCSDGPPQKKKNAHPTPATPSPRWYGATYGSWGWKTPPMGLNMFDQFGNKLHVTVQVSVNLQTWEVYSARVYDYRFYGNSWGK